MSRAPTIAALSALAAVACIGLLFAASDEAEATHFWSGSLSWEHVTPEPPDPLPPIQPPADVLAKVTGYIGFDTTYAGVACDQMTAGTVLPGDPLTWGDLTANGVSLTYAMLVRYVDPNPAGFNGGHCRFAAQIVDPVTLDGVVVPVSDGQPVVVQWGAGVSSFCCRENNNHINNPNLPARMETYINTGDPNRSPIIDFAHLTRITSHGAAAYGNHHCPRNSYCKFYVEASDPDNDTLTWRKATSAEATGGGSFKHPGPPWTGPFAVDPATGLVTWDTTGASEGQIYSTQIIVEDGITKVPVDFMVEIGKGCENGNTGTLDPITGELICETPDPDEPEPDECTENPDGDGCRPMPPPPPVGKKYQHVFWPPPQRTIVMQATVSDSQSTQANPSDESLDGLSKLDSDKDDIDDAFDLCPGSDTTENGDPDGDGRGNGCDADDDNDGILDEMDACPTDPDPYCGIESQGSETSGGDEGARGFMAPAPAAEKEDSAVRVQADPEAVATTWPYLGILAAAVLVLLVLARRRA